MTHFPDGNPWDAATVTAEAAPAVPEHSHLGNYTAVQDCPRCMQLGAVNPDTGSRWPSLDEHGEQVLAETEARFHDRYDGPDSFTSALEVALREAYLRGRMQGRKEKGKELAAAARGALTNALSHLRSAVDAAEKDDVRHAASHASLADAHLADARLLRGQAGSWA